MTNVSGFITSCVSLLKLFLLIMLNICSVHIILGRGGDFRGSIYRLEVYDYLPSDGDRALIGNNMPLPKPPCAPWDFYDLRAALYVNPSTYSPGGSGGGGIAGFKGIS